MFSKYNNPLLLTLHFSCRFLDSRFKRVDGSKLEKMRINSRLHDQSYFSKNGDSFAAKAANDLIKVRGKDFRREMQKKKRASWKGSGNLLN